MTEDTRQYAGNVIAESLVHNSQVMTEPISDDQELFLKVLENLKNAVTRPDSHVAIPKKPATYDQELYATPVSSGVEVVGHESQSVLTRSDISTIEPGTTKVTVSDKTKSLILQKLACEKAGTSEKEYVQNSEQLTATAALDHIQTAVGTEHVENVVAANGNFGGRVDMEKVAQKSLYSARPYINVNKTNIVKTTDRPVRAIQKQTNKSVQLYPCSFCDYYSDNKSYLKQHIDFVHISDRPFKCPYCEYAGKRSHALREHLIVHTDERPFQCTVCKATFRKKGHLTNHVKLHNSKRLVKCPLCKALVYDAGENGLDVHLKNDHDTERLYGCDLCDHIAANEPDIIKHLRQTHKTQIVSHKCEKCPYETANSIDFTAHMNAHRMADNKVQIGENSPTKILGVATFPKDSEPVCMPNTIVKMNSSETIMTTPNQPAVIKPVWIKCSECGFTGQDSEVIRKHMLKHLKEQGLEIVPETSTNQQASNTPNTPPVNTEPMHADPPFIHKAENIPRSQTPILVPVTNIDLLPQHAGKIDMNSPILVPVTDAAMLKKLQQLPVSAIQQLTPRQQAATATSIQHSPLKLQTATTAGQLNRSNPQIATTVQCIPPTSQVAINQLFPVKPPITTAVMTASAIPRQTNRMTVTSEKPAATCDQNLMAQPVYIVPNVGVQTVVTLPTRQIEQIVQNPNLKVIPLSTQQFANRTIASSVTNSASHVLAQPPNLTSCVMSAMPVSASLHTVPVRSVTDTTPSPAVTCNQPLSPFCLTQIPIPRPDAPMSPPKLPPQFAKIEFGKFSFPRGDRDDSKDATTTKQLPVNLETMQQGKNTLNEKLANVHVKRIIEQDKPVGSMPLMKFDAQDISEKTAAKNIVFYVEPIPNQSMAGKNPSHSDFIHDSSAGRFKCTLCGYTCEHQRTIKAHIWKHSGNKNVDYPMFQNGPLSVHDDEILPTRIERNENVIEIITSAREMNKTAMIPVPQIVHGSTEVDAPGSKMPPFIVYEHAKISNVAPALANLIAARTMVGLKRNDGGESESTTSDNSEVTEHSSVDTNMEESTLIGVNRRCDQVIDLVSGRSEINNVGAPSSSAAHDPQPSNYSHISDVRPIVSRNVVVEAIADIATSGGYTGYTSMQSQQNSPRIATKSPDSGITEIASAIRSSEDTSSSMSSMTSPVHSLDYMEMERGELRSGRKRVMRQYSQVTDTGEVMDSSDEASSSKKIKVLQAHEDSAVTLLSLLKKGPNYNPACPPKSVQLSRSSPSHLDYSNVSSPGQDDSNSLGDSEMSGSKPKSGISTSLLAVIEQLRERSKSDADDERPPPPPAKKSSKRRSRKSSQEDNTPASGIENVEEFSIDGEVKFRCKLCHYTNESTMLLRQHMRLHKPKQEFECSLCDLIAESSEALQDHMIQHCKVRTYQCKLCNSTFNYKSQLRAHMRMHNDQGILFCDYCDFETRNMPAMKVHTKSHLTKPQYKCELCQEDFISSYSMRLHRRDGCNTNVEKSNTSFKCEECDSVFFGRREMKNHLRMHMGRSTIASVPSHCPYCDHAGSSIESIQKHVSDVHGESKPLKCNMCGFFAVSIRSLKSHMKRHVNDQRFVAQPLEQYKCNLCGYVCHHLPSLKSHMWRHAPDQHYSYEFTNDVINAAIDFDGQTDVPETTEVHVEQFKNLIFEKMKVKGLENTHGTLEESAVACCWVTFRCCQCGFETINKADLNMHMGEHSDIIKMTLEIADQTLVIDEQGTEVEVM